MKLLIHKQNQWQTKPYDIISIKYQLDENNIPIDIRISTANKDTLISIGDNYAINWNIREIEDYEPKLKNATHEALFDRLPKFEVLEATTVEYT